MSTGARRSTPTTTGSPAAPRKSASPPGSTQPEDITQNEDWQEEQAEFRRQDDQGELGHINEHHPFPPTRYE